MDRYFAVLGLSPQASEQEVKEARNFVTKAFHPDKYEPGSKDQERAHQKQVEINEAYQKIIDHFERVKKEQALLQPKSMAGVPRCGSAGPGQVSSMGVSSEAVWHPGSARNGKVAVIVTVAKVALVLALCSEWIWTVWSWIGAHSASAPIAVAALTAVPAPEKMTPQMNSSSAPATTAVPAPQRTVAPATASALANTPQATDDRLPDLLLLLFLVLSTLAIVWFLFAPESRVLIERLVAGSADHD